MNEKSMMNENSLAQQYVFQKGMTKFGKRGKIAALNEVKQLHDRVCWKPISIKDLTKMEKERAQEALMFLSEKGDKTIKGRAVYNGKPTRVWHNKEDSASPTASTESIFITATIDAKEFRDVMSSDIPNAFIQASMAATKKGERRVIMKITGILLDLLVSLDPELYGPHVVYEDGKKVLYLEVIRALYGMLVAALLWYQQFRKDLEGQGFKFTAYDPCDANRVKDKKQQTIKFHVDDLKSSHVDPKVNDDFYNWLNRKYGKHGKVKVTRGKCHSYLGMHFEYTDDGKVIISMKDFMRKLIEEFPEKITKTSPTPATDDFFAMGEETKLPPEQAKIFHTWVAKALFACKRARPDIHPVVTLLCTRVKSPR
jgi:hypothetical protein